MIHENKPTMSRTDKLCLVALAGILIATTLVYEVTDGAATRAASDDKLPVEASEVVRPPLTAEILPVDIGPQEATLLPPEFSPVDFTPLVENFESYREELFWQTVPLDQECREALVESCEANHVPLCLALGVIHEESSFDSTATNSISYGYMGLNVKYFPSDLTPEENIRAGVSHLAWQIERYNGDIQAALRSYNRGYDDGDRKYARAVLDASEKWGRG